MRRMILRRSDCTTRLKRFLPVTFRKTQSTGEAMPQATLSKNPNTLLTLLGNCVALPCAQSLLQFLNSMHAEYLIHDVGDDTRSIPNVKRRQRIIWARHVK